MNGGKDSVKTYKYPITILTTTYNRVELLHRLFESLIKQSAFDFEWIIVDDGSTDKTKEYVKSLNQKSVDELKIDQSVAHNGVCLTVVKIENGTYTVTAMKETLDRSNLGLLKVGDHVNVERSMMMNGRLDGHIVQGHVDETAKCINMRDADGSTYFTFEYADNKEMARKGYFTVDKGSVTVNGVSLTVCEPTNNTFTVAIIPYTRENTNFKYIEVGTVVNLEFDILGKYIARLQQFA